METMNEFWVTPGDSIQNALEKAAAAGGGKVILAPGTHRSGTIYLRDNVELHLPAGSRLLGGSEPEDYSDFSMRRRRSRARACCSWFTAGTSGLKG